MFYIQMAFLIFLIIGSGITMLSYSSLRSQSKKAFADLAKSPITREATEQEKTALKPILLAQPMDLSYDVYTLSGYYLNHGVKTNSNTTEHHTIGDVEVFLPYDANLFLSHYSEAEVILGPTFAVVLKLNGLFDITTARERITQQQLQKQIEARQLLHDNSSPHESTSSNIAIADTSTNPSTITVLGERQETPLEAIERYSPWGLFWCFVTWVFTLIILGNSLDSTTSKGSMWAIAGILTTFGLFWYYRPARLIKKLQQAPQTVKQIEGQLSLLQIASPTNAHQVNDEYFIGDEIKVTIPEQWRELPLLPLGRTINAEIRAEDNSVVRLGNWKIADEYEKFPVIYKGRYIFLMVLGIFSLFCYWLADGSPKNNIRLATLHFTQNQANYDSVQELIAKPPKPGSIVTLSGKGSCLLKKTNYQGSVFSVSQQVSGIDTKLYMDCNTIHWREESLTINKILPDNNFLPIYSGDFIETKIYNASYGYRSVSLSFLQNPPAVVQTVEDACQNGFPHCSKLKQSIMHSIKVLDTSLNITTWQAFSNYAHTWEKQTLNYGLDTQVRLLSMDAFKSLHMDEVRRLWPQIEQSLMQLIDSQKGGVFITSDQLLSSQAQSINSSYIFSIDDLTKLWNTLSNISDNSFSVTGMVTDVVLKNNTAPIIYIDTTLTLKNTWSGCNYTLWLLFSLLMLGYGTFMFFKLPSLRERNRALKEYLTTREYH